MALRARTLAAHHFVQVNPSQGHDLTQALDDVIGEAIEERHAAREGKQGVDTVGIAVEERRPQDLVAQGRGSQWRLGSLKDVAPLLVHSEQLDRA